MSGWGDVDKKQGRTSLGGRFVQFEDNKPVVIRILDEEPHTTRVHKISQSVTKGGKTEEVFRSIPATESPDDNMILKLNGKRYPDVMSFHMRGAVLNKKDDAGKDVAPESALQILQGGPAIFKPLRDLFTQYGSLSGFDISITRKGKGRDTEYTVTAAPVSKQIDVKTLREALAADEAIGDWSNVFPPTSAADQQKMIEEAGFDIARDPAAEIAASMSPAEASTQEITFGKYKGKKVGEIAIIDSGYLQWAADNVTSNDKLAAACRVAVGNLTAVASGQSVAPAALPAAKPAAETKKAETAKENPARRGELLEAISDRFDQDPRYEDIENMVAVVKKHGGGKTKVKDLTLKQLEDLHAEISA